MKPNKICRFNSVGIKREREREMNKKNNVKTEREID
jgi:hypothetical protein